MMYIAWLEEQEDVQQFYDFMILCWTFFLELSSPPLPEEVHCARVPEYYVSAGFPIMEAHLYSFSASNYVFFSNWNKMASAAPHFLLPSPTHRHAGLWEHRAVFQMFPHNYVCLFSFLCLPLWEWLTTMFVGTMLCRKDLKIT